MNPLSLKATVVFADALFELMSEHSENRAKLDELARQAELELEKPVTDEADVVFDETTFDVLASHERTLRAWAKDASVPQFLREDLGRFLSWLPPIITELRRRRSGTVGAVGEAAHHKLDNERQVFFYEQEFYVLSNFSAFSLVWAGNRYDTSEAAYHHLKFVTGANFDNPKTSDIAERIRKAPSAHAAFKLASENKALQRPDWDDVKVDFMRKILRAKVHQHEYVRRKLLETGDRELIEDSWRDDFWGWGPNRDGQNMLGKLWMEVRAALRAALGGD